MLYEYKDLQSRAANGENQRGEKGQGGMARGGRKGWGPCRRTGP